MLQGLIALAYLLSVVVAARVVYTKAERSEWLTTFEGDDMYFLVAAMSCLVWPVALLVWGLCRFVTAGARKGKKW